MALLSTTHVFQRRLLSCSAAHCPHAPSHSAVGSLVVARGFQSTSFQAQIPGCHPVLAGRGQWRGGEVRGTYLRRLAKFQQFKQGVETANGDAASSLGEEESEDGEEQVTQDEGVLPDNLEDAVLQSSGATATFVSSGGTRAIAELLLPELDNLNEEGAQQRLWDLSRLFLDTLQELLGNQRLKAIFPDAGSEALVKYQWKDAVFSFGSLNDRRPVTKEDEVVVLVAPDYQMLADVERIASLLSGDDDTLWLDIMVGEQARPLVMWNPRLVSGDVGVGLNVRRMRERLLSTFTTVYSVRSLSNGTIFRQYPGLWQVFLDDKTRPGRLVLATEQPRRPSPEDLDMLLLSGGDSEAAEQPSTLVKAMGAFASFNRFLRSLSN